MIPSGNTLVLLAGGVCFGGRESGLSRRLTAWANCSEKLTPFVLSILSGFDPSLLDVIVQMGCEFYPIAGRIVVSAVQSVRLW